jgi:polynucleotide 5'-kinase involved in rRNA processing
VLVDTCGLVSGDFGRRLKQGMIAAIDPDVVIAVERAAECDAIVRPYAAAARPTVVRVSAAAPARGRTPEMRRAHRERALAMYLSGARSIRLDLSRIPIRRPRLFSGTPIPTTELGDAARVIGKTLVWAERHADVATVISREALDESEARTVARALGARRLDHHAVGDLEGMLAGMEDRNEEMISLGVVEKIDFGRAILRVTTPARPDGIVTIAIGRERYTSANTPAADASM